MRPVNRHVVNSASSPSHYHHHGNMIRADAFPVPPSRGEERRVYSRNQGPLVRFLLCRNLHYTKSDIAHLHIIGIKFLNFLARTDKIQHY